MCGPTAPEKTLESSEQSLASSTQQDFLQRFSQQGQTLGQLNNILQNVQNGKLLPGFSSATNAALNTQAIDTTAGNFRAAQQSANNANAGRGGNSGLQPGTVGQENATIASNAASQLSSQQQQIQLANQQAAQQNTAMTLGGYQSLAGLQNPEGFGSLASSANQGAFGEANQIAQQQNQKEADIAGGITGLAMDAATFGTGAIGGGGLEGGLSALSGRY